MGIGTLPIILFPLTNKLPTMFLKELEESITSMLSTEGFGLLSNS